MTGYPWLDRLELLAAELADEYLRQSAPSLRAVPGGGEGGDKAPPRPTLRLIEGGES
jgi:hypothetical protein